MEPRERTHLFATPEAPRLRIRTPSGQVSIETDETTETTVELEPLRSDDVTRTAIAQATVELRGNEVVVEVAKQGWGFLGRSPEVAIRIRCPYGSTLDCTTASADVEAAGRLGETSIKTASGDVELPHVGGSLTVHSASGDVRVELIDGEAQVKTVSGDVRIGIARSALSVNLVSGDFADRRGRHRPLGEHRFGRSAGAFDPRGPDQAAIRLRRHPGRRRAGNARLHRRQLDERRRPLRARRHRRSTDDRSR